MWITKREWARHQRELRAALDRAKSAEDLLAGERQSKDWMVTQLTSRFVTKQGGYGLDTESQPRALTPHPKGFIREPDDLDIAKREYYRKCYRDSGRNEEEADKLWEAEMRGETPAYEYEQEELIG